MYVLCGGGRGGGGRRGGGGEFWCGGRVGVSHNKKKKDNEQDKIYCFNLR